MTDWAYYDKDGKRVPPTAYSAAFKAREVPVSSGVPAPAGHGSLSAWEFHDVHALDNPNDRKVFKSASKMRDWFRERPHLSRGEMPEVTIQVWNIVTTIEHSAAGFEVMREQTTGAERHRPVGADGYGRGEWLDGPPPLPSRPTARN